MEGGDGEVLRCHREEVFGGSAPKRGMGVGGTRVDGSSGFAIVGNSTARLQF